MKKPKKRNRVSLSFEGTESMTLQSDRTRTQIERIMAQGIPQVDPGTLQYADVSDAQTFVEMQNTIAEVNNRFSLLPSKVRYELGNDPANMLKLVHEQPERAAELGLIEKPKPNEFEPDVLFDPESHPDHQPQKPKSKPAADEAAKPEPSTSPS